MYYIASLAKFDNRCNTGWVSRQDQWEGNNYSFSFEGGGNKVTHCFTTYFWTSGIAYPGLCQSKIHWCPGKNNVESYLFQLFTKIYTHENNPLYGMCDRFHVDVKRAYRYG